jgi:hypothetical protein
VRLSPGHGNLEFVRAGLGYAGVVGKDARLQGADHVQAEDSVRFRLEGALRQHASRAANLALWQILLGGLEYQCHRAAKLITMGGQYFGDRHQNGGVAIMPAGMHHPYVLSAPIGLCDGREGQAGRLRYRQRVYVSAERDARARTAAAGQRRHHASHRNLLTHLVIQRAQVLRDKRGSPHFLVAKLWVLMNASSPFDHSCFDSGRGCVQSLVDRTRRRRSAASAPFGAAPISAPTPQAQAAATMSRRLRPLDDAASAKNALRVCRVGRKMDCMARLNCGALPSNAFPHSTILRRGERQQVGYWMMCPYGDARAKAAARSQLIFGVRPEAKRVVRLARQARRQGHD